MPAERQYRRVLRLLPAGYRDLWEEDMVSAYLDSVAESPRRSAGEWLSVAWLALRLRLNGSHAKPRTAFWRQLALGVAVLTTLYESLHATVSFAYLAWSWMKFGLSASWQNQIAAWWDTLSLVWVATFVCLILGRRVAARALVLIALAYELGLLALIVRYTINPSWWHWPGMLLEYSNIYQAWLGLTAVAVFLVPMDFRPPRAWLAAYLVPATAVAPIVTASVTGPEPPAWPQWLRLLQFVNVGTLLHVGIVVGMLVALTRARRWLFPLAVFGGGVATVQLLGHNYGSDFLYGLRQQGTALWAWVNVGQLALAVACAIVGFVAVLRARRGEERS
jgi:hypothetical protein